MKGRFSQIRTVSHLTALRDGLIYSPQHSVDKSHDQEVWKGCGSHDFMQLTISTMPVVTMAQVSLSQQYLGQIPRFLAR